eukprot:TRINITY_DN34075_c0_g1_i2.p1 TRINITY_DN34075_c0_g1~~TRINITY_DN34075_c0_g1_i2.p1  ORF type:complete len:709 (+),score=76.84 TRINITY_DN34075_c0_g1_i2:57-2183(+)
MALEQLNRHFESHSYLGSRTSVTLVDYRECERLSQSPIDAEKYPHLSRWHSHVTFLRERYPICDRNGHPIAEGRLPALSMATHEIALGDELQVLPGREIANVERRQCYRSGDLGRVSKLDEVGGCFDIVWYRTLATTTCSSATWKQSFSFITAARDPVVGDELRVLRGVAESPGYSAGDMGIVSAVLDHTLEITWYGSGRVTSCTKDAYIEHFITVGQVIDAMPSEFEEQLVGFWHAGRAISFASQEFQLDMDFHVFRADDGMLKIEGTYLARDVGGTLVKQQWCSTLLPRVDGRLIAISSTKVRILLKPSDVDIGVVLSVGSKSYHLYRQGLFPGRFVRLDCSEQFVKKSLSPFTQIWWSEDLRDLLGSAGIVIHVDGRDGTAEVGHWQSLKEASGIAPGVLNRPRWLPISALHLISAEEYATHVPCRKTHPKMQQAHLPAPLKLPVCTMSGHAVASVSINSLDSKVMELHQDVARQAGLCHHAVELVIQGSLTPMAPTASLQMYADALASCTQLYLIVKEDEANLFKKGLRVEVRNGFSFDAGGQERRLETGWKGSVLQVNDDGDVLVEFTNRENTTVGGTPTKYWVKRNRLENLKNLIMEPPQGGIFRLRIRVGCAYPFDPPSVHFVTKILHCNIDPRTGDISLDLLQDQWSPAMTISKVIVAIQSLLADPNPEDPVEPAIALMYLTDREQHDATVREWVRCYAH